MSGARGAPYRRHRCMRWAATVLISAQLFSACRAAAAEQEYDDVAGCPNTAAQSQAWGKPDREDNFADVSSLANWWVYDGPGHDGNGRRTPSAVTVSDGHLVISGDASGNSGGVALKGGGQMYGRWEICARSSVAASTYHSVALLWPDANDWPAGGEIDFMEIVDPARQTAGFHLHYGPDDQRENHYVRIDATRWHSWAVEWTPQRITVYVDGTPWAESAEPSQFPPRPMHLCLQLDNFGGDTRAGGQQYVDWVRQYSLPR